MKKLIPILLLLSPLAFASAQRIIVADVLKSSDLANSYTINYANLNTLGSGTTFQYMRGDGTLATLDTSIVPENTNLYFTDARAIAAPITGFVSSTGTVTATDTLLQAIGKLDGNAAAAAANAWSIDGNAGTTVGTNFLGTVDAQGLIIRTNNADRINISDAGQFAFYPNQMFVNGTIAGSAGNYDSMLFQQAFSAPVAGGLQGPYMGPTFNSSIANNYTAFGEGATFATGSSANGYVSFYSNAQIQSGATVGNMSVLEANALVDAGTMDAANYNGVYLHPNIASDLANYYGVQNDPLLSGTIAGNYLGFWDNPTFQSGFVTNTATGFAVNMQVQSGATLTSALYANTVNTNIASGSTVGGNSDYKATPNIAAGATIVSSNAFTAAGTLNADMSNFGGFLSQNNGSGDITNVVEMGANSAFSGDVTNYTGLSVNPSLTGTNTNVFGVDINMSGATADQVVGLKVDVGGSTSTQRAVAINAGGGVIALNGGQFETVSNYPSLVDFGNLITSNFHVASGSPITGTDVLGTNGSGLAIFEDDFGTSAFGLGYAGTGYAGQVSVVSGKTVDKFSEVIAGGSYPATSTGGTITNAYMYRAFGLVNGGGSLNVTNMYGFHVDNSVGGFIGTNNWGFFEDGGLENAMSKLAIDTGTNKVANASTALEIGSAKGFINGRGDTATKNALTAVAGMQFYDTDLDDLEFYDGTSWVSAGGSTASTPVSGETPSGAIDNVNVTFTLANTPVAGTLHLYIDGNRTTQFSIAGATITMNTAPLFAQVLIADYNY